MSTWNEAWQRSVFGQQHASNIGAGHRPNKPAFLQRRRPPDQLENAKKTFVVAQGVQQKRPAGTPLFNQVRTGKWIVRKRNHPPGRCSSVFLAL